MSRNYGSGHTNQVKKQIILIINKNILIAVLYTVGISASFPGFRL